MPFVPRPVLALLMFAALLVSTACGGSSDSPAKPSTTSTKATVAPATSVTPPPATPAASVTATAAATTPAGTATPDAFAGCTLLDKPDSATTKDVAQLVVCAQGNPTAPKVIAIHHWVARNPNLPVESLRKLSAAAEYPSVRCGVAGNPSSPEDLIVSLNAAFPSCVAANPSAPIALLGTVAA